MAFYEFFQQKLPSIKVSTLYEGKFTKKKQKLYFFKG